ncbi:phosphoadenosine phosphosulfate reductase [Streptomyces sp. NPDC058657]|uniref:phosphoadenosine phosphosulfate reductase n=1 Tax=unclassified Streptomyces TaxID=2593676 RepID=UPI003659913D
MSLHAVSYGGGVQSTALMVLAARGEIPFKTFLFANVGEDSEDPETLEYVRRVAAPYAKTNALDLHLLDRTTRSGNTETLWGRMTREGSRALPIPIRMSNGAPGTRGCTRDFKIQVTGRWLKAHGACAATPATVAVGISLDEISRANNRRTERYENVVYPLLDLGLRRTDCQRVIADAGLPMPPKSACWFCPLKPLGSWREMRRDRPALFFKACALEKALNESRAWDGKGADPVFLTRTGRPLNRAVAAAQEVLPFDVGCDSGWCMT